MIVVFGTICLDRLRRVERLPRPGEYVEIESEAVTLGGEAANTVRALRAWGAESVLVGSSLGAGTEADRLKTLLEEAALGDAALPAGDHDAPFCDIYVTPDGERTMFGRGFREMGDRSDPTLLPEADSAWLAVDMNLTDATTQALRIAKDRGWRRYGMDIFEPVPQLSHGDLWQSSTDWTGTKGNAAASRAWLRSWAEQVNCTCILTDGPQGLWVCRPGEEPVYGPAYTAPVVVDATGAGDRFRAAMLYCLDLGLPFGECIAFAAAASALNCGHLGAAEYTDAAEDILSWAKRQPEHSQLCRLGGLY